MHISRNADVKERRMQIEEIYGELPAIAEAQKGIDSASTKHCEQMIGFATIPMGIVGPLSIESHLYGNREHFVPLATTEGALVASVQRGCKTISESGGVSVQTKRIGATRGPVFLTSTVEKRRELVEYIEAKKDVLAATAAQTSHHLTLLDMKILPVGQYTFVRFVYDTQDAMGLNMVTLATEAIARKIEQDLSIQCVSISGNYCVDKKPSWLNFIEGRGIAVWADCVIPEDIVQRVLKVRPLDIYKTWHAKCMIGNAVSGSMGSNAQIANVLSAIFLATGQDPAHVVEGSMGITTTDIITQPNGADALAVSVYIPDLMIATVGGGTALATQHEALSILGLVGGDSGKHAEQLAEVIGATVLAGEVSLLASLAEGSLGRAHERLARGKQR